MSAMDKIIEDALDAYIGKLTIEQQQHFDNWVRTEAAPGRLLDDPTHEVLRACIISWMAGWNASHDTLVEDIHEL